MRENTSTLVQNLGRRYVSVLAVVAALLLLDQAVLQPLLLRLNGFGPVINLAGRQRMLSQRLTKGVLAVSRNPAHATAWQIELRESLTSWKEVHEGLQTGDRRLELPGTSDSGIRQEFKSLDPHFRAMCAAVEAVIADPANSVTAADEMLRHERACLQLMDRIVGRFEDQSRQQVQFLRLLGLAITITALSLMAGLSRMVVRPALKLIRQQMQQLSTSELKLRSLVERMHDGLAILSADGRITYANERFARILQRELPTIVGEALHRFVAPHSAARLVALLTDNAGACADVQEVAWALPGGGECMTLAAPGRSQSENAVDDVTFIVMTDITRQKQAEAGLREARDILEAKVAERTHELTLANADLRHEVAEREIAEEESRQLHAHLAHATRVTSMGQLATGLAHEINQPLGAIANYADALCLMIRKPTPSGDLERTAERLREAAERAGRIVRRMRNFLKPRPAEKTDESLNKLIADVVELCATSTRNQRVDVVCDLEATEAIQVRVDAIQVQQVLLNLVSNALHAMSQQPAATRQLTIRTLVRLSDVVVDVEDSGPGFPPAMLTDGIVPFQTTKPDGLGMGLSISQSLIAAHEGEFWNENLKPCGARVSFSLPVQNVADRMQTADSLCR